MSNKGLETDTVSENNRYRLSRVRKGMYEAQVLSIMRQPYQYETFDLGEDVYDVWFYITNPTVLGQSRMVAQNLTPLSFKNGVLVGTGYDYYYYITREMAKQRAAEMPPEPATPLVEPRPPSKGIEPQQTPKQQQSIQENKALEESLQKATKPSVPQPTRSTRPQKAVKPTPAAPESESLQPETKPTAPIVSSAEPLVKRKTFISVLAAKKSLSKVRKGMSETEVQQIMGAPVDTQSFDLGEDVYDVWFYETKNSEERTPLTFKNGFLVGTTPDYYNGIKQAASHDQVQGYDKEAERMQEDESEQNFDYW
jgi:outer membrane protein assembly factor BamE (lipoprotein component of BamABCDE complex)